MDNSNENAFILYIKQHRQRAVAVARGRGGDGLAAAHSVQRAGNIGGFNYFRLRYIAILLNFGVSFNSDGDGTIRLDFDEDYSEQRRKG